MVGQAGYVIAHVFVGEYEQALLFSEGVEDALADFGGARAGGEVEAEDVDGVVMPGVDVGVARDQQAALLIGEIAHDSGDR